MLQPRSLQGKTVQDIDMMVEEMTRAVTEALDKHTPKISTRTLPHPKIHEEMKKLEGSKYCLPTVLITGRIKEL